MHVTDEQLLDFRAAVHDHDHAAQQRILREVRDVNPECTDLTDENLTRALLHLVARLLSEI